MDQSFNSQNDRYICVDPADVAMVFRIKKLATAMVLVVISSEGDIMLPHFFSEGLKINQQVYLDVLEQVVVPWIKIVSGNRTYTFQQDSAPAHKAKKVQSRLLENVHHF